MTQRHTPLLRSRAPSAHLVFYAPSDHYRTVRGLRTASLAPCPLPLPPLLT
jgi:hypothetical protein